MVEIAAQIEGPIRRETLMGKEYLVAPAVLVRAQVLNNNLGRSLLPPDALTPEWAAAWNGVPVVVDHPSRRGTAISARDPEVLNAAGAGFVFRARAEEGVLKADVFIDPDRAEAVNGLSLILSALREGRRTELSTGFPTITENASGTHDGKPYDKIMRPSGTDHLAIFADKTGACSLMDGCGLGVNCEDGCTCNEPPAVNKFTEAIDRLVAFLGGSKPATNEEETMSKAERIAALQEAGCPLSKERLEALNEDELEALGNYRPEGEEVEEEEPARPDLTEAVQALQAEIADLKAVAQDAIQEAAAEKTELVAALAASQACAFDEPDLKAMTVHTLRKLASSVRGVSYAGRGGPRAHNEESTPAYMPPKPYWEQKEAN